MSKNLFTVMPMSQRISLAAGQTYHGSLVVANPANATDDFSFLVEVTPYSVIGSNYQADLSTKNLYTDLSDWITIENPRGTIAPNQHARINYTITVPEQTHAGGQYATLLVSSDPDATPVDQNISINNTYQLASIIYADLSGEINHDCKVLENKIPNFSFNPNLTLEALIQNIGNIHEDAIFVLNVTNVFTGESIYASKNEEAESYDRTDFMEIIMPETTRYITHQVENLPPLGLVKVNQTIYIDDIPSTTEKEIFICPLWFIILVAVTIVALISFIVSRILRHRRHKLAKF